MERQHWLQRRSTIRRLWVLFYVILFATVFAELLIKRKPLGALDALFGFNAWYGFLTCVAMVAFAKALGFMLKRRDDYYDA